MRWTIAIGLGALALAAGSVACGAKGTRLPPDQLPRITVDTSPLEGQTMPRIVLSIDRPIEWTFRFVNSGKSPALHVASRSAVIPGGVASTEVDAFFRNLPERLAIGGSEEKTMPSERGQQPITARSVDVAYPEDFNGLSHDGGLYLVGRFEYGSPDGRLCRTDFCRFTLERGGLQDCPTHNDTRCDP